MKYFKLEEFRCRCGCEMDSTGSPQVRANIVALVENVLDPVRERLAKPIIVNSGYRCQVHNKTVGGASSSQHMRGEAADVRPVQGSGFTVQDLARVIVANGRWDQMILYPTFVHVSWKRQGVNRKEVLKKTAMGYEKVDVASI